LAFHTDTPGTLSLSVTGLSHAQSSPSQRADRVELRIFELLHYCPVISVHPEQSVSILFIIILRTRAWMLSLANYRVAQYDRRDRKLMMNIFHVYFRKHILRLKNFFFIKIQLNLDNFWLLVKIRYDLAN